MAACSQWDPSCPESVNPVQSATRQAPTVLSLFFSTSFPPSGPDSPIRAPRCLELVHHGNAFLLLCFRCFLLRLRPATTSRSLSPSATQRVAAATTPWNSIRGLRLRHTYSPVVSVLTYNAGFFPLSPLLSLRYLHLVPFVYLLLRIRGSRVRFCDSSGGAPKIVRLGWG